VISDQDTEWNAIAVLNKVVKLFRVDFVCVKAKLVISNPVTFMAVKMPWNALEIPEKCFCCKNA